MVGTTAVLVLLYLSLLRRTGVNEAARTFFLLLTRIGNATAALKVGGFSINSGPLLHDRLAHLRQRVPSPATKPAVAAVLLSHAHMDLPQMPSMRQLHPGL